MKNKEDKLMQEHCEYLTGKIKSYFEEVAVHMGEEFSLSRVTLHMMDFLG